MGTKDIKLLGLTLVPVLILITLTVLAPIYYMPNGSYERHWVWDAPTLKVGHGYDNLKPEDIERLNADPHQRKILEGMKEMPREMPISPIYIGTRWGPGRNSLGYITMMCVIAWFFLLGYKWMSR